MPRINIEDKLFADSRFIRLVEAVGNYHIALGLTIELIRLGQKYWIDGKLIPWAIFKQIPNAELHLKMGLSKRKTSGVYICGSEELFAWIRQKVEAGRKSAKSRWNKSNGAITGDNGGWPPAPVIEKKNAAVDLITPRRLTKREIEEQKNELLRRAEIWNREQSGQLSGLPSDPELPKNSKK